MADAEGSKTSSCYPLLSPWSFAKSMHKSLPEKDEIHTPHCFTATINIMQALFLINYNKPYQRSTFGISQPNIQKVIYGKHFISNGVFWNKHRKKKNRIPQQIRRDNGTTSTKPPGRLPLAARGMVRLQRKADDSKGPDVPPEGRWSRWKRRTRCWYG